MKLWHVLLVLACLWPLLELTWTPEPSGKLGTGCTLAEGARRR